MTITFCVPGKPEPAGSKRAYPFKKKDGGLGVRVTDDNPKGRSWKDTLGWSARDVFKEVPMRGPVVVSMIFHLVRPKGHLGRHGTLVPSAPAWPVVKPDVLKLARAVEDALTGIIWHDDAQIVREHIEKRYAERAGVTIRIEEAP